MKEQIWHPPQQQHPARSAPRSTSPAQHQPPSAARAPPQHQTPHLSIWFYGALSLALALSGTFVWLAVMSTLVRLVSYMISIAALPRLEQQAEAPADLFYLPGGRLIPALAMLLSLWLILQAPVSNWITFGAFAIAGTGVYFWCRRRALAAGE